MGVAEATLAIGIGTAVAGAATSAAGAIAQNRAVKQGKAAAARAADTQRDQVRAQVQQAARERSREAARVRGLLRVRGAAAGVGPGSSFEDLIEGVDLGLEEDLETLRINEANMFNRINSGLGADLSELEFRRRNAVLDSLGGGISGAQSGLAIGHGIKNLNLEA